MCGRERCAPGALVDRLLFHCLHLGRSNMASAAVAAARKSVFVLTNLTASPRTINGLFHRQLRSVVRAGSSGRWLEVQRYCTKNGAEKTTTTSMGLADELLSAKIQADPKDRRTEGQENTEQNSEKEREKTWRTLKLSFITFGVMVSGMGGFLIWTWG